MKINKLIINSEKNIQDALLMLNKISLADDISRLILFVQLKNKIIGSITDGDIRRYLVTNSDLNTKVKDICNKNFAFERESTEYINFKKYSDKNLKIIPVLNQDDSISRIVDINKQVSQIPLTAVIMAGGRGKRLGHITDKTPKPMLKVNNIPIIEHNIKLLSYYGIKNIYISVGYLGEMIKNHLGDGSKFNLRINYISEEFPLGTAGALKLLPKISHPEILLMNADLLTNINIEKMYLRLKENNADFIAASNDYIMDVPYGIFELQNSILKSINEKPKYVFDSNAGIYIFNLNLIKYIPDNKFFNITELIYKLINKKYKLLTYRIKGYWIDIGSPQDLKRARSFNINN